MLVQRLTFHVKSGNQEKVVKLMKESRAILDDPHGSRIYTSNIGLFNIVVYELEVENLAELDAYWEAWWSKPETAAFMEKWNALMDSGGGSEIWTLVE
jgi:hypothetical protein